ncbi:hypothetical protein OROMI_008960 [Orobanche minor]
MSIFSFNDFDDWRNMISNRFKDLIGESTTLPALAKTEECHQTVTASELSDDDLEDRTYICSMVKEIEDDEDSNDKVSSTSIIHEHASHTFDNMLSEFKNIKKAHEILKRENLQFEISNLELVQEHDLLKENYEFMSNDCENSKITIEKFMEDNHQLAKELNETKSHIESKINDYVLLEVKVKSLEKREGELEKILNSFEKASKRLEDILSTGQNDHDKCGLGYNSFSEKGTYSTVFVRSVEPVSVPEEIPIPVKTPVALLTTKAAIPPPKSYHRQRKPQPPRPVRRNQQNAQQAYPKRQQPFKKKAVSRNQRSGQQYFPQYSAPRYWIQKPCYLSRKQSVADHQQQMWESSWRPKRQAARPKNMDPSPRRQSYWRNNNSNFCIHCYNGYSDYVPAMHRPRTKGPTVTYSKPITVRKVWVPKDSYPHGPNIQREPSKV